MMKLLLSPHCDDETLFASYTLLRHHPNVLICFNGRRARHLPPDSVRQAETTAAMRIFGCKVDFAGVQCDPAEWDDLEAKIGSLDPEKVWAPLPEPGGNLGHNGVGNLAAKLWPSLTTFYSTYSGPDNGRTEIGTVVDSEPNWADRKLMALDCYVSQKMYAPTAFHFSRGLREYQSESFLPPKGRRLNLGGGINPIEGFDNLDKSTGWEFESGLPAYADDSVEAITISHTLMYVDIDVWPAIFSELYRVLIPGGFIRITEDDIGAPGNSRPVIRPGAAVPTTLPLLREHLLSAGFDAHPVSPNVSLFYDTSLIQQNYGQPPDVFHVEGIKPS